MTYMEREIKNPVWLYKVYFTCISFLVPEKFKDKVTFHIQHAP